MSVRLPQTPDAGTAVLALISAESRSPLLRGAPRMIGLVLLITGAMRARGVTITKHPA